MKRILFLAFAAVILGMMAGSLRAQVLLDFETAGQFSGNFRVLAGGTVISQTSNGASNDSVRTLSGTSSVVYDANGAGAGLSTFDVSQSAPLTISVDVSFNTNGNSFGIHLIDPADETKAYLALFNVNFSSVNDQFRFSSTADPTTAGAGTLLNGSFANNANTGISNNSVFSNISLVYSINGSNNPVLTLTAGSETSTITLAVPAMTSVEVGFRSFSSGVVAFDNVSIIPEPSAAAFLAVGLPVLFLGRRFCRAGRARAAA